MTVPFNRCAEIGKFYSFGHLAAVSKVVVVFVNVLKDYVEAVSWKQGEEYIFHSFRGTL